MPCLAFLDMYLSGMLTLQMYQSNFVTHLQIWKDETRRKLHDVLE